MPGVPAALEPGAALEGSKPTHRPSGLRYARRLARGSTDIEPALATRWHASRDGLVWSFTLREGVRFHDGSPLTALEVAASFERQLKPEAQGAEPGVARAASRCARSHQGGPRPWRSDGRDRSGPAVRALVTVLAHPGLAIAKHSVAADGAGRLIGTGPYRVVDASTGRLALEAMPGHWAGPAKSERLVFLDVSADDQAESELDSRSLDVWFPAVPTAPHAGRPVGSRASDRIPGIPDREGALREEDASPGCRRGDRSRRPGPDSRSGGRSAAVVPASGVWARREGSPILGGGRAT